MSRFIISRSSLSGRITIPPSKSHTMRAILFAAMAKGKSIIKNTLLSKDAEFLVKACRSLGASIEVGSEQIIVNGVASKPKLPEDVIDAKNSGQTLYYIGALCSLTKGGYIVITGDESIRNNRPVTFLLNCINQLGGTAFSTRNNGYAPIVIKGPVKPGETSITGHASLPVSAQLFIASFLKGKTTVNIWEPGEKPWVNLTLSWLDRGNVSYSNSNFEQITIWGNGTFESFDYSVPADFSSAAYPIAAALITGSEITLENIDMCDVQGDKELIEVFKQMGGDINYDSNSKLLHINKTSKLNGVEVNINNFIDSITILPVVACFSDGKTIIKGANPSRYKECDRIYAITKELEKMGARIKELDDGLIIYPSSLKGTIVETYSDHRMALSLAVAGMASKGTTTVLNSHLTEKSFPNFAATMRDLGANITTA